LFCLRCVENSVEFCAPFSAFFLLKVTKIRNVFILKKGEEFPKKCKKGVGLFLFRHQPVSFEPKPDVHFPFFYLNFGAFISLTLLLAHAWFVKCGSYKCRHKWRHSRSDEETVDRRRRRHDGVLREVGVCGSRRRVDAVAECWKQRLWLPTLAYAVGPQ
jgi:hypothetical protein